jgi:acyl carrier protein
MKKVKIADIINEICEEKDYIVVDPKATNFLELKLREDIGFDSFDLAQLTVMIEDEFDIDVFEDGIIETVGEIIVKKK